MDNVKKHKIFDDDAVMVEAVEVEKPEIEKAKIETVNVRDKNETKNIAVEDVLDSFAGYLPNRIGNFVTPGDGECIICGAHTISPMRKVCFDCMVKYGQKLYKEAKKMLENGELSFKF